VERALKIPSVPAAISIARQERITWVIWAGFTLAAVALLLYGPKRFPVNQAYAHGAASWEASTTLYDEEGCGFIYPPQAAILHWPFVQLPHSLYELFWRMVNLGLFAAGVYRLAGCCAGDSFPRLATATGFSAGDFRDASPSAMRQRRDEMPIRGADPVSLFLIITLLTLPKTWTLALNGQATTAMAGLMLLAVVDVAERRWWRASAALLLAMAFKPLAIVLLLLVAALFPPLLWRISAGGLVYLAIPYLTRHADYVTAQYAGFIQNLGVASAIGHDWVYPSLFAMLHMVGVDLPIAGETILQITAALSTLGAGWLVCRRFATPQGAVLLYSLAACYLLLFNPRTENNSYTLLMPAVAAFTARALLFDKRLSRSLLLVAIVVALTGGFEITRVITPRAAIVWICPLACVVFVGFLVGEIARPIAWSRQTGNRKLSVPEPVTERRSAA
jgi:alpha-1,2-mannosyltransferase